MAIFAVLRTEPPNPAAPRCCFEPKLHNEPLLRPDRPMGAVLLDLIVSPGMVSLALGQPDVDARSRVIPPHTRDRRLHQCANSHEPLAPGSGLLNRFEHVHDMLAL